MKKFLTLIALTLTSLLGYSQATDFMDLMDFDVDGTEVSFIMPDNTDNYSIDMSDVGGSTLVNFSVNTIKLTSSNPSITFDCGECVFNPQSSEVERTFTVTGFGFFQVQVEMTGSTIIGDFPGTDIFGNTLTAYNFNSPLLESVNTTSVGDYDAVTFEVSQNYPNPFNNITTVEFNSPKNTTVDFSVFDISGKMVENRKVDVERGVNTIEYGDRLSSGVYFYSITHDNTVYTKRMVKN